MTGGSCKETKRLVIERSDHTFSLWRSSKHDKVKSSETFRNSGRAPHSHIGLQMLLLAAKLCKDGEHAVDFLTESMSVSVSMSMSIQTVRRQGARRDFIDTPILI